jgi:hypothetical protein
MRRDPRISRRTTRAGYEVFVIDVSWRPTATTADTLGQALTGARSTRPRCRAAQRVHVDDALFELTLDELVDESRPDDAVVLQSRSRLAGIRALPAVDDSPEARDREVLRLRNALCGHT